MSLYPIGVILGVDVLNKLLTEIEFFFKEITKKRLFYHHIIFHLEETQQELVKKANSNFIYLSG